MGEKYMAVMCMAPYRDNY